MVFWLVSPTPDPRRPTPARQACCRVFRPKNAFLWRAVAFFREKTRSSGVLSRLFAEKRVFPACDRVFPASCHVFPACCRVYPAKNAFIRRVVAFFREKTRSSGVLSRFSAEKRVHPACYRVFSPKNVFILRKTRLSSEKRVFPTKNAFIRARSGQPGWLVLSSKRDALASAHAAPPVRRGLPANGERLSNIHLPAASFITSSSPRRAGVTITIDHA